MKKQSHSIGYLLVFLCLTFNALSQNLYTARGYWEESNKETYRKIKQKERVNDPLNDEERNYLIDYERYLANYFERLSDAEKLRYEQMKPEWDRELLSPTKPEVVKEEFEWRGRDRFVNFLYGAIYGTSFVLIAEIDNAAAVGIPLVTGGLWALGPVFNPKKYETIDRPVLRASNTGKFLGFVYGASLGIMLGGDSENTYKTALGLGTLSSIALGEVGFQLQKKRNFSEGHIELMRHYGVVGPWLGLSGIAATNTENVNLIGASLLAGGVSGLLVGNQMSKKYDYTKGDVDNISTFTWISTGIGFTVMLEAFQNNGSNALLLIPAAGTVLGTALAQKSVRGVYLTKRQGSTISYSSGGAALLGLGLVTLLETESATVAIGVPTALALITQQILFHKYKGENLLHGIQGRGNKDSSVRFSVRLTPENYFINQRLPMRSPEGYGLQSGLNNQIVNLKLTF
ncbi:MAG: hypothetical protein KF687_16355 [Cyclobacteriaceae bacterium]|nr:hypothetical protein [Cyclobacteriaceae bacterium]